MEISEALYYARELMDHHGLSHWRLNTSRAKTICGSCDHTRQQVNLSRYFIDLNPWSIIRNTVLHEIAHALTGPQAGHGPLWKEMAIKVGAKPERINHDALMPSKRYSGVCPCGHLQTLGAIKHRKPSVLYVCAVCRRGVDWVDTVAV